MYCTVCVQVCTVLFVCECVLYCLCASVYCTVCVRVCIVLFVCECVLYCLCANVYCTVCVQVCIVLLPPGVNPIAVNKYVSLSFSFF